jgi:uncharacterized RDD family membrane protein YckC
MEYAPPLVAGHPQAVTHADLADRSTRLGAQLVDGLAGVAILLVPIMFLIAGLDGYDGGGLVMLGGLGLLAGFGWLVWRQLTLLAREGQTIGKRALGVRIVRTVDGSNPGGVSTILARGVVPGVIGSIPVVGPVFSIANVLFIFRENRRCLHDYIAGTSVVRTDTAVGARATPAELADVPASPAAGSAEMGEPGPWPWSEPASATTPEPNTRSAESPFRAPSAPRSSADLGARLVTLAELNRAGMLDDDEYVRAKAKLVGEGAEAMLRERPEDVLAQAVQWVEKGLLTSDEAQRVKAIVWDL